VCHMRRRIHVCVCHMRRRIHVCVCHMRRRIHVCHLRNARGSRKKEAKVPHSE
jgi:hypothetical protein